MVNVVNYTPHGDKRAALSLRHVGERLLAQVRQEMSWNNLPQLKRTFTLSPCALAPVGAVFQVHSLYGVHCINVFVPFAPEGPAEQELLTKLIRLAFVAFYLDPDDEDLDQAYALAATQSLETAAGEASHITAIAKIPELLENRNWSHKALKPFISRDVEIQGGFLLAINKSYTYHPEDWATSVAFFQSAYLICDPNPYGIEPHEYQNMLNFAQIDRCYKNVDQPRPEWYGMYAYATNFWIDPVTNEQWIVVLTALYTPPPGANIHARIELFRYSAKGDLISSITYNSTPRLYTTTWSHYWTHSPLTVAYDGERVYTSLRTSPQFDFNQTANEVVSNSLQSYGGSITRDQETDYDYDPLGNTIVSRLFNYVQSRTYTLALGQYDPPNIYMHSSLAVEASLTLSSGIIVHWNESYHGCTATGPYGDPAHYLLQSPSPYWGSYSFTDLASGFFPRLLTYYDWLRKRWVCYDLLITRTSTGERREGEYYWVQFQETYRIYDQDGQEVYHRNLAETGEIEVVAGAGSGTVIYSGPLISNEERPPSTEILNSSIIAYDAVEDVLQDFMRIHSLGAYQPYGENQLPITFCQTYQSVSGNESMIQEPEAAIGSSSTLLDLTLKPWRWVTNDKMLVVTEE